MEYWTSDEGAVPVVFCERQRRWLPIEDHLECEYCTAPVRDADDEPISFLCTYFSERIEFRPGEHPPAEEGRGPPARPPSDGPPEPEPRSVPVD